MVGHRSAGNPGRCGQSHDFPATRDESVSNTAGQIRRGRYGQQQSCPVTWGKEVPKFLTCPTQESRWSEFDPLWISVTWSHYKITNTPIQQYTSHSMVSLMTAQWLRDNDIKARSIADWPATRMRHVQSHDCTVTWEFDRKRVRSIADWPEPGRDTVSHTTVQTSDYLYWNQLDGTSNGLYPLKSTSST